MPVVMKETLDIIWVICNQTAAMWGPTSETCGVTKDGSGWGKEVANQCLESGSDLLQVFKREPLVAMVFSSGAFHFCGPLYITRRQFVSSFYLFLMLHILPGAVSRIPFKVRSSHTFTSLKSRLFNLSLCWDRVLCFVMGYMQFWEIAHKRVHYYYYY